MRNKLITSFSILQIISFFTVHGKPDITTTIPLNEGDALSLQVPDFYSNPYSQFSFYFNNTLITPGSNGHTLSNTTTSTTMFKTLQGASVSKATVDHTSSGVYQVKACNMLGCKTDEWRVVVQCKLLYCTIFRSLLVPNCSIFTYS